MSQQIIDGTAIVTAWRAKDANDRAWLVRNRAEWEAKQQAAHLGVVKMCLLLTAFVVIGWWIFG